MDEPPMVALPPIKESVSEFNDLPRPEKRPDGSLNHWVFGACHFYLDSDSPADIIIAVYPQSEDFNMDRPGMMVSMETGSAQAEATVPYLLAAFLDYNQDIPNHPPPSAPWTWSILDADKAQAVQDVLEKHGVRPENKAAKDPDARALLKSLHLESCPVDQMLNLHLPLRCLVLAGQDIPKNLELLFGPHYEQGVKKDHENMRIECLLDPPPGSPSHAKYATTDAASLNQSLRPATEAEQERVKEVRDIQERIRKRRAEGEPPSQEDTLAILWPISGRNWEAKYPAFVLARKTMMDLGIVPDGFQGLSLSPM
ncbi:hypothetical protein B0T26DRAFT_877162 [Lasiosphaeria miniovina]|uniref:Uncharacterized protein n=1 Tax=Lasiosphaeria miniovina TaxID=1954250 RepID=A0AA39ZQQ3_9PEZI|nr:uncharacterized protein B0T26DRAFT_877162 [Lasiosphaeria miniovina]KAK0701892.1 hypothetical protein B0T26DRAFT_877162 [Lasiosphaeria miniovina]